MHLTALPKRNVYVEHLEVCKQALTENNIAFKDEYVIINNLSQEAGAEAAVIIRNMKPLPDAMFAANDNCAVGCMVALKQAGIRILQDIAFVEFNMTRSLL